MPTGLFIAVLLLERDPVWNPLRKNPAFQKLIKQYTHATPGSTITDLPNQRSTDQPISVSMPALSR